jgi:hypothetical protein
MYTRRSKTIGNSLLLAALGAVTMGGLIAARRLLRSSGGTPEAPSGTKARPGIMTRVFEGLPPDSPPKLIMTILPRLREQNDDIISLLREQNELLRRGQTEMVSR